MSKYWADKKKKDQSDAKKQRAQKQEIIKWNIQNAGVKKEKVAVRPRSNNQRTEATVLTGANNGMGLWCHAKRDPPSHSVYTQDTPPQRKKSLPPLRKAPKVKK